MAQLDPVTVHRNQIELLSGPEVAKAQSQALQQVGQGGQPRGPRDREDVERVAGAFGHGAEHLLPDLLDLKADCDSEACLRDPREGIAERQRLDHSERVAPGRPDQLMQLLRPRMQVSALG